MTKKIILLLAAVMTTCSSQEFNDMDYRKTGIEFVQALVEEDFRHAYGMLTDDLRKKISEEELAQTYRDMIAYGQGPVKKIIPGEGHSDYPDMKPNELGGIYISLVGDYFVEGIAVYVCRDGDRARVREIDWGRP